MQKRDSLAWVMGLLLVVAYIVVVLCLITFVTPEDPKQSRPGPTTPSCRGCEDWEQRYMDEAWQQFSH